jgi:hypothetical protein
MTPRSGGPRLAPLPRPFCCEQPSHRSGWMIGALILAPQHTARRTLPRGLASTAPRDSFLAHWRQAMPRDGALTLSDLRGRYLHINCGPCARRGRYAVAELIAAHGDAKLPDLLTRLADCPMAQGVGIHDGCKARFDAGDLMAREGDG